jgi:hypothetical protein
VKIIESEKTGRLKNARILEADDGTTAVEMLRREMSEGRKIDFVLMDYVMVSSFLSISIKGGLFPDYVLLLH